MPDADPKDALAELLEKGMSHATKSDPDEIVEARLALLRSSGIEERLTMQGQELVLYGRYTTDDGEVHPLEQTDALRFVQAWFRSSRPMLVLLSPGPGVGKTLAAAWALSRRPGRYTRARDLCELRYGSRKDRARFRDLVRSRFLVVDEIGLERDEAEAADTLHELVDVRQRLPRSTLIAGNLTGKQLAARYDDRTLDRLGLDSDAIGIAVIRSIAEASLRRTRRAW